MMPEAPYHPHHDVLRDKEGNPVTITWDQVQAVNHALVVWREVYRAEKGEYPDMDNLANFSKSCLMGRMLVEGRPPMAEAPPVINAAPAYHLVDPELCPSCGRERSGPGAWLSVDIGLEQQAHHWARAQGFGLAAAGQRGKTRTLVQCIEDWHEPKGVPSPG